MNLKTLIPPIDESEKHAAWALYMGGFDADEIVGQLGCNINTLRKWISADGWFKEREAVAAARNKKNPPEKSPMAKVFAPDKKAQNVQIFKEKTGTMAAEDAKHWADMMGPEERLAAAPNIAALNKAHRSNLDLDAEAPGQNGHITLNFLNAGDSAARLLEPTPPKQLEDE